jgi:hypothetical protein
MKKQRPSGGSIIGCGSCGQSMMEGYIQLKGSWSADFTCRLCGAKFSVSMPLDFDGPGFMQYPKELQPKEKP